MSQTHMTGGRFEKDFLYGIHYRKKYDPKNNIITTAQCINVTRFMKMDPNHTCNLVYFS